MNRLLALAGLVLCIANASAAQVASREIVNGSCNGPVYRAANVARPARLINFGNLTLSKEAAQQNVRGSVIINAVLCRDGSVRDMDVVRGLPLVTQSAINKLLNTHFAPAELNFHSVSQELQFQFTIDEHGVSSTFETDFPTAPPRLVEEVVFLGLNRVIKDQAFARIKTLPGDAYKADKIERDLQSILKMGEFDPIGSHVLTDDAARGGVRVVYDLVELPLIREVKFINVSLGDQVTLLEGLRKFLDLRPGAVFDPPSLLSANRIIEGFFKSRGTPKVKVENLIERPNQTEAIVIFKITPANIGP
jgi:hypothetical protein